MTLFELLLLVATLLCSLVAGFLFAYAVVVMPGMANLSDREFIRAFQVMDRVIQDNQPLFMVMWVGSVITLVITAVWGGWQLAGAQRFLLIGAAALYLLGVQLPTAVRNIPLNNALQTWDVSTMDETTVRTARTRFELDWNRWNVIRTALAIVTSALLLLILV